MNAIKTTGATSRLSDQPPIGLIVTGDDFGHAGAINAGIVEAFKEGCLTSASLSVAGPAAEEAADLARDHPSLGIGLHVTLVGQRAVAPPDRIPTLVDDDGRLPADRFAFARRWYTRRIDPGHVTLEIRAQFDRARALGLDVTHVDGEDHLHVLPGVLGLVIPEMDRAGVPRRIRIPLEARPVERASPVRHLFRHTLNFVARRAVTRARAEGLAFPDRFLGFLSAGHVTAATLTAWIDSLTPGITEISLHPARSAGPPRPEYADWGYDWQGELDALLDTGVREALEQQGVTLLTYDDLG